MIYYDTLSTMNTLEDEKEIDTFVRTVLLETAGGNAREELYCFATLQIHTEFFFVRIENPFMMTP